MGIFTLYMRFFLSNYERWYIYVQTKYFFMVFLLHAHVYFVTLRALCELSSFECVARVRDNRAFFRVT